VPPRQPEYSLVSVAGKSHAPVFTARVFVAGLGEATASARSRKEAESLAAAQLLARVIEK
ncbi:MAG: ribonuclease III, partial [Kiritimatiellae bacterium]|nr:ribonuclease III [Kiritimatiellia bacterium]